VIGTQRPLERVCHGVPIMFVNPPYIGQPLTVATFRLSLSPDNVCRVTELIGMDRVNRNQ